MNEINKITKKEKVNKKEVTQENNETIEAFRLGIFFGELFSSLRELRKQKPEKEEKPKTNDKERQKTISESIKAIEASESMDDYQKTRLIEKLIDKID